MHIKKQLGNLYRKHLSDKRRLQDYKKLKLIEDGVHKNYVHNKRNVEKNKNKYLIISGIGMEKIGLFCCMSAFIKWVEYADANGYLPVVDMQNVPSQYLDKGDIGKKNAWEFYYKPFFDSDDPLKEALESNAYRVVNRLDRPSWMSGNDFKKLLATDLSKDIFDSYFVLNSKAAEYINDNAKKLFSPTDKVLGVLCRGSDYVNMKPSGHAVQPTADQLIQKIHEVTEDYHCNKIYVATEDSNYLAALKKEFGTKLVYLDCLRVTTSKDELTSEAFDKKVVDRELNGLNYLTSISLLSMCDCIIAGRTQATRYIKMLRKNGDYEYYFAWNLGDFE